MASARTTKRFCIVFHLGNASPERLRIIVPKLKLALDRLSFTSAEQAFRSTNADLFGFLIESKLAPIQIKAAFDSPGSDGPVDPKKPPEPLLEGKDALLIMEVGTDCLAAAGFTRVGAWLQRL